MRYRHKVDANHVAIVTALKQLGCSVESLAGVGKGVPDLLCGFQGRNLLLEVKVGAQKKRGRTQQATDARQAVWREAWRGPVVTVRSVDEAVDAVLRRSDVP